ncbi:MAG: carbohydrate ABC transporter permease [Armatimonadota bacterium]|nr:carbohydrate ABC transporter permease [Armatimonadota bacterium]MDR7448294.1 carbohydrate ABC transporter permease [Armatimonadota bacterium]MDR7458323.1 carbohydrate ABC transporter permease [Armatimonadota bacterium]MDR7478374.1 carbohydrate ABC transporter permease [Armatimonadota bacterium]MDR7487308.1 carbohydrate ABC transporter permease [Armatimonadota bacterium]
MRVNRPLAFTVVLAAAALQVFPLLWMVTTAFKTEREVFGSLSLWPTAPTLENFRYVWTRVPMLRYVVNSLAVAAVVVAGQLLSSILAAYAFARLRPPGREAIFLLTVGTMLVPFQITMIPNFLLVSRLGWIDTIPGLAVPHLASAFGIFLLRQHFLAFPASLEEAAALEGASRWQILWRVVVPVNRGALGALAILFFIQNWNEYFWPLLVARDRATTLPLGLARFVSAEGGTLFGPLMAAATMATVPAMALFLAAQREIVGTYTMSGLKG